MNKKLRLALAQINLTVGDFEGNAGKIIKHIRYAHDKGADILAFPELAVCGYPPEDLLLKPHFIKENEIFLKKITLKTSGMLVLLGLAHRSENSIYNSCAIIYNKEILGYYHKRFLPNYAVFDEKRYFEEGKTDFILKHLDVFVGVDICEDIWREEGLHTFQWQGVELVINLSASPYYKGKIDVRRKMLSGRAQKTKAYVAYCNLVGGQDELVFDGGSMVFGPSGKTLAEAAQFKEELLLVDVDLKWAGLINKKDHLVCGKTFSVIDVPSEMKEFHKPEIRKKGAPSLAPEAEVYEALKLGLRDYVRKNHFEKVVLGLSGGIDSALCVTVAVDALGKENTIAVIMPSKFSSFETFNDAVILAKKLDIKFFIIPIDPMYQPYLENLKDIFKDCEEDITEENIQARIRGNILMALSNKFGYLVLTTGNKSETSVGYCTLYGDMAGGFAVLKDVPKTLVYKLAKYRNSLVKNGLIPSSIIQRAPTAELRFNQKDQDTLPPYDILDEILKLYVEQDKSLQQIIEAGFDKKIVKKVINMVDRNEYKRRQSPPGIRITPKAFGKDRRMPISNQYVVK